MSKAPSNAAGQSAAKKRGVVWPTARRPAWITDQELEWLPADTRQEVVELIASTYQELVVEAASALERAAGEEFVFLFWLGFVRSLRLRGHSLAGQVLLGGVHADTEIQNYLQLGLAKQRVTNLLLRVKEWHARWQRDAARQAMALPDAMSSAMPSTLSSAAAAEPAACPPSAPGAAVNAENTSPGHGHLNGQPAADVPPAGNAADGQTNADGQADVMVHVESGAAKHGRVGNGDCPDGGRLPEEASIPCAARRGVLPDSTADGGLEKPQSEGQNGDGPLNPLAAKR